MKISQWNYLGPKSTPHDIRQSRKQSFDWHKNKGEPIIHKHRWTWVDVRAGKARRCPLHNVAYDSDSQWDEYCFGTGFVGGWDDGVITFASIADAQEDTIKILPEGQLLYERHPAFTAPWTPPMGDGDLLIRAEFDFENWNVVNETDRYILQEITPFTIRGISSNKQGYKIQQQGNLDRLPDKHRWLDVPYVFDYTQVPDEPVIPVGGDPSNYPLDSISAEYLIYAYGLESGVSSSIDFEIFAEGAGNTTSSEYEIMAKGEGKGAVVVFED